MRQSLDAGAGASPKVSSPRPPPVVANVGTGSSFRGTVAGGVSGVTHSPFTHISVATKLGARRQQEDRCLLVPSVHGRSDVTFAGVFDGTVGDHAAQFVHHIIGDVVCNSKHFRDVLASASEGHLRPASIFKSMEAALLEGYRTTDEALLSYCAAHALDYTACTSVTCVLAGALLSCAHLGDSKAVLGRMDARGDLSGRYLTTDHKPDMPAERHRVERAGGLLVYLHGAKPFLRGGDFLARQARGERSMQLNYSRAFGGKDLKCYGLSATPDLLHVQLSACDKLVILASDGLWDVCSAQDAVHLAWDTYKAGADPSLVLTDWALAQHAARGSIDNVTVIVIILALPAAAKPAPASPRLSPLAK